MTIVQGTVATRLARLAGSAAFAFAMNMGCTPTALAHPGDKGFATITLSGQGVDYSYSLPLTSFHRESLRAAGIDADEARVDPAIDYRPLQSVLLRSVAISDATGPCRVVPGAFDPPNADRSSITIHATWICPGRPLDGIDIRDDLADTLGRDYVTLANVVGPTGSSAHVFHAEHRNASIVPAMPASAHGFAEFVRLGIVHILVGWDHLLFLAALVLPGGGLLTLFKVITAFTVAHSVTLAAAALDVVTLPDRLVEAAIALSIAWVAARNLLARDSVRARRWIVAFAFGLLHGFGFSAVLRDLGLPADGLVRALLGFNLGVELGQLFCVALFLPPLLWLARTRFHPSVVATASAMVLAVGLGLFVQRAFL